MLFGYQKKGLLSQTLFLIKTIERHEQNFFSYYLWPNWRWQK